MTMHRTRTGGSVSATELDALAEKVEHRDYDVDALQKRRRGRPAMGSAPAEVVPVRIDPELRAAVAARAESDRTTTSEIIREALRQFLRLEEAR